GGGGGREGGGCRGARGERPQRRRAIDPPATPNRQRRRRHEEPGPREVELQRMDGSAAGRPRGKKPEGRVELIDVRVSWEGDAPRQGARNAEAAAMQKAT